MLQHFDRKEIRLCLACHNFDCSLKRKNKPSGQSAVCVTMSDYNTVAEALVEHVQRCGEDAPFYIFRDVQGGRQVYTLGRVHLLAGRCAAFLRHRGVAKGSRVMVSLVNSPERLVTHFGLLFAGAVCVNGVHQMTDGSDLIHCLRHSRASVILLDPDVTNSPWTSLQDIVQRADDGTVTSEKLPDLRRVEFVQRQPGNDFLGRLEEASEWFMEDSVQRSDDCFVFPTSGTTGFPKLVVHSHHNFVTAMEKWSRGAAPIPSEREVRYQDAPLGCSSGNVTIALMTHEIRVLCDDRVGLPQDRADFITRCILEENCTRANLSRADLMAVHQHVQATNGMPFNASLTNGGHHHHPTEGSSSRKWRQLDQVSLGGQPVTSQAVEVALSLARSVLIFYGTTELSLVSVGMVTPGASYHDYNVGRPLPGIEVRVVDEGDSETVLSDGQIGQVLIQHPTPFTEYLHDPSDPKGPKSTAAFTDDGFYRTGDRGKVNEDKSLTIFGRTGDTAITRGQIVHYPHVLEAAIGECPGVADVVVIGVPDPLMTEEFCACVVPKEGVTMKEVEEEAEKKFVGPSVTRNSFRPRYYLRFESLPQLYTGRADRRRIKEMAREKLAAE